MNDWIKVGERGENETFIRPWSPGDGLVCSHAAKQRRTPCGPPAASKMVIHPHGNYVGRNQWREKRIRTVVCASHLAGEFTTSPGDERIEVEKAAREQLIVAHWDEYQTFIAERLSETRERRMAAIPEPIRELICDRLDEIEAESEGSAA